MITRARNLVCGLALSTAVLLAPVSTAAAQQSGLVNVDVGNITILREVGIGVAANVVAEVCGVTVQQVNVLAQDVAQSGNPDTVCTAGDQTATAPITIAPSRR